MPTINQLIRKGREQSVNVSKSPVHPDLPVE